MQWHYYQLLTAIVYVVPVITLNLFGEQKLALLLKLTFCCDDIMSTLKCMHWK